MLYQLLRLYSFKLYECEWWIGKNVASRNHGPFKGNISAFAWRAWRKPQKDCQNSQLQGQELNQELPKYSTAVFLITKIQTVRQKRYGILPQCGIKYNFLINKPYSTPENWSSKVLQSTSVLPKHYTPSQEDLNLNLHGHGNLKSHNKTC